MYPRSPPFPGSSGFPSLTAPQFSHSGCWGNMEYGCKVRVHEPFHFHIDPSLHQNIIMPSQILLLIFAELGEITYVVPYPLSLDMVYLNRKKPQSFWRGKQKHKHLHLTSLRNPECFQRRKLQWWTGHENILVKRCI